MRREYRNRAGKFAEAVRNAWAGKIHREDWY